MTFLFEKTEPLVVAGVNWPVLEYLIERFNRTALEGCIVLKRSPLQNELQLGLSAECNGLTLSLVSEPFADVLLTEGEAREQLIRVVSRFLLKAKHEHAELFARATSTSPNSLSDLLGEGAPPTAVCREVPDSVRSAKSESFGPPSS